MNKQYNYGVVIERATGQFVSALRWEVGTPKPKYANKKLRQVLTMVTDEAATADPIPGGRWDDEAKVWRKPDAKVWIVQEATGQLISAKMVWADNPPELPRGFAYVDIPPLTEKGRKPIWDAEKGEWTLPHRVGMIDPNGFLRNIVLENPRGDTEDVSLPKGWKRIDERKWPSLDDGTPVQIGDKRGPGNVWTRDLEA